jgi:hypothetical protein
VCAAAVRPAALRAAADLPPLRQVSATDAAGDRGRPGDGPAPVMS